MPGRLVLLGSPLLGPAVWRPAARRLAQHGAEVTVVRQGAPVRSPGDALDGFLDGVPDEPGLVLVPHSNAGLYVAALAAARDVAGVVFVDALLPSDQPTTPTADEGMLRVLRPMADLDGLLPPWTAWWSEVDAAGLFPDAATRAVVEAEQPRLPVAYLEERVPSPSGWAGLPAAYLGFGDTYAEEQAQARRRGWHVEAVPGRHLHQLVDPGGVAEAVLRLAGTLRTGS
jgi:hypothetical protein